MNPTISMFCVGIGFGVLIGILVCDFGLAQDRYYEQQNRIYNGDDTNTRQRLDNYEYELRNQHPTYTHPRPC